MLLLLFSEICFLDAVGLSLLRVVAENVLYAATCDCGSARLVDDYVTLRPQRKDLFACFAQAEERISDF